MKIISGRVAVIAFFVTVLLVGVLTYRDYGGTWDEAVQRQAGMFTCKYAFEGTREIFEFKDRYHGPFFEVILVVLEKALHLTDSTRNTVFMRHFVTFLSFYIGLVFFYFLSRDRFKSWKIGLVGCLFLVLSPRIYADSFYNCKDIPFLAFFIIATYTLIKYLDNKTFFNAILHALATAFLIDIRIPGLVIPFLTVSFFMTDLFSRKERRAEGMTSIFAYLAFSWVFIVLFWPFLWERPVGNFLDAIRVMGHFPWNGTVLYFGKYVKASELPWHYVPVWIIITTPLLYLFLFLAGFWDSVKGFLSSPVKFYAERRSDLVFAGCFLMPIFAVIIFKSILYDGWRQMYFVYPAFLMIALVGLNLFIKMARGKKWGVPLIACLVAISSASVGYFMVKAHPFQNVYFNSLMGKGMQRAIHNFELDYWGASYRKALEFILRTDQSETIKVFAKDGALEFNRFILLPEERKRIVFTRDLYDAKYFVTNHRWEDSWPESGSVYSIKVGAVEICAVNLTRK